MADERSATNEAAALLRRAASLLTQSNDRHTTQTTNNNNVVDPAISMATTSLNNRNQSVQPVVHTRGPVSGLVSDSNRATTSQLTNEEFRRLFAPYNAANNGRLVQQPPTKRSRANTWGKTRFFKPNDTWTHDFFCLADTQLRCVPTRIEKVRLQDAGLGRKRITFHKNDDANQVKAKLEHVYPKLATGGGFELLRSSVSPRDLDVMAPPNQGYSVPFLRDSSGLGQAIAYIRPIQKGLDTTPLQPTIEMGNTQLTEVYEILNSCTKIKLKLTCL